MPKVKVKYCGSIIDELEVDSPVEIKLGSTLLDSLEEDSIVVYSTKGKKVNANITIGSTVYASANTIFKDDFTVEACDFIKPIDLRQFTVYDIGLSSSSPCYLSDTK